MFPLSYFDGIAWACMHEHCLSMLFIWIMRLIGWILNWRCRYKIRFIRFSFVYWIWFYTWDISVCFFLQTRKTSLMSRYSIKSLKYTFHCIIFSIVSYVVGLVIVFRANLPFTMQQNGTENQEGEDTMKYPHIWQLCS